MNSYLTISEILQRKHFDGTILVAGKDGIHRSVKWVHIVENPAIRNLLNGGELILSTGIGWGNDEKLFLSFVQELIECHATGLCIELGTYIKVIPETIRLLADKHNFPIIIFQKEVPFVQITQDIHSMIINQQYKLISNLESYSQNLNKKLLEINNYEQILHILHDYLKVQVFAVVREHEITFVPAGRKAEKETLLKKIRTIENHSNEQVLTQPIQILGQNYAELYIYSPERELTEFDAVILDRTATALAQHFLRELYVEEKKIAEESKWLRNWLDGEYSEEAIQAQLSYLNPKLKLTGGVAFICKFRHQGHRSAAINDNTYLMLLFRTVFEQAGFQLFSMELHQHLIFILGDRRSPENWKERVSEGFQRINKVDGTGKKRLAGLSVGVGQYVFKLGDMFKSYKTAKETIMLQETLTEENSSYFYQDLHMYRILSLINKHSNLQETVYEYLEPVIDYDLQHNGELMVTLKEYLACNGSKQETSKKLFIVRQTLYHRLEKLEKLLGANFMQAERRQAIEFMLLAYDYLNSTRQSIPIRQNL